MLAAAIPSPRRLNPVVDPVRNARAARRVLWLMASAGYIQRDVAGLGSEPPPEVVVDEDVEAAARAGLAGLRPLLEAELERDWPSDGGSSGAVAALADVMTELVGRSAHAR